MLSGGCFELIDGWGLLFGCHLLTGVGYFVYWVNWWLLCGFFCGVCVVCNTMSLISHIHRTNKTISVSLTNANSKRDSLVFLSLISFPLHNSNTRAKIQRAKIQPHRGKMDNYEKA